MKKYVVDTNVFLRFILKDNLKLYKKAEDCFIKAKRGEVLLILLSQVVFEIDYVLRGVYNVSKKERVSILSTIVKSTDLDIEERSILIETVEKYKITNVDLVDIYLFEKAKKQKASVFSFDKDFKKIFYKNPS